MTETNRLRLTAVRESTLGVTPDTPRMKTVRITGESLSYMPENIQSEELRSDRMNGDPIKVNEKAQGSINAEVTIPRDGFVESDLIESAMFSEWARSPSRDNDGTADSIITALTNSTDVATVTTGAAFVTGALVRFTDFSDAANNGVYKCTTGSATVPAFVGAGFVADAAPAAAARMKTVGFQGASGDITAAAAGLASTTLDFTTLGLQAGQWIKIGGTATSDKFAVAALNTYARISGTVTAHALPLDNLPAGWATNSGSGKTIKVFTADLIKNGTATTSFSIEKGFMGQDVPTYIAYRGMVVGQWEINFAAGATGKSSFTFSGLTASATTTSLDAAPDAASTVHVLSAATDVGRVAKAGSVVAGKNYIKSVKFSLNNNLRMIDAIRSDGLVGASDIKSGECSVKATIETYFGDNTLYADLIAGTAASFNTRATKDGQTIVYEVPRLTYTGGTPPMAGGKNQDVILTLEGSASVDPTTSAHLIVNAFEYVE